MEWAIGLLGALGALVLGILNYRRSKTVDATSAQSGVASNHRAGTAQIIEGLNALVDQLQEENATLRSQAESRAIRLETMTLELARLRKRYGVNNDDTPIPPGKAGEE